MVLAPYYTILDLYCCCCCTVLSRGAQIYSWRTTFLQSLVSVCYNTPGLTGSGVFNYGWTSWLVYQEQDWTTLVLRSYFRGVQLQLMFSSCLSMGNLWKDI